MLRFSEEGIGGGSATSVVKSGISKQAVEAIGLDSDHEEV